MPEPRREDIAGRFYTVEDLMNLPESQPVDPAKAREVSIRVPLRLWISTEELIALLEESIENITHNAESGSPDVGDDAEGAAILIAQRRLWIRHLQEAGEEDAYIGLHPASTDGEAFDDEAAVRDDSPAS